MIKLTTKGRAKYSQMLIQKAISMRSKGSLVKDISAVLKMTPSMVRYYTSKNERERRRNVMAKYIAKNKDKIYQYNRKYNHDLRNNKAGDNRN